MVAKPPTITAWSSDIVIVSTNGRTTSGASVWPTKMLAAAERVSEPEVPIVFRITLAIPPTTHCIAPRW